MEQKLLNTINYEEKKFVNMPRFWNHRLYRSGLEVRWDCVFHLLNLKHEYEPYNLKGWIPDFSIFGNEEILVNIKFFSKFKEFEDSRELEKIYRGLKGTDKYGKDILLLGCTTFEKAGHFNSPCIGWLGEYCKNIDKYIWGWATLNKNKQWGFFHDHMSYRDRITNAYAGKKHIIIPSCFEFYKIWEKAGNMSQWFPIEK